jgi:hypothetical protein
MYCSWYGDVDIVLSMIDMEYLRMSQICCHGNCCRLSTDNLQEKIVIRLIDRLRDLSHVYTTLNFWYGTDKIGIRTTFLVLGLPI